MKAKLRKIAFYFLTHLTAFVVGGTTLYFAAEQSSIVWGFFLGSEVYSQVSFPRGHMARIYSAWGFGEQQLIFVVDGTRVYRTPDFAPGNVDERIVWDESGTVVSFRALGRTIYAFDTKTGRGMEE